MKKIKSIHSSKDRVVCVATPGKLDFYYQPARTKERLWLLQQPFSGSIWHYFYDKGRNMYDRSYSLTIAELYKFNDYKSPKLNRLFSRLPSVIDYVITESALNSETTIMENLYSTQVKKRREQICYTNYDDCVA